MNLWLGVPALVAATTLGLAGCTAPATNAPPGGAASAPGTTAPAPGGGAQGPVSAGPDWTEVAEQVAPGVVAVSIRSGLAAGQGSGVVIDDQGHIVTNHHVVAGAGGTPDVTLTLWDNRVVPARVIGTDPASDLAVLAVENTDLTPVPIGDDDALRVGDPVLALGNPLGLAGTVTSGMVSSLDRPVTTVQGGAGGLGTGEPVVTNAIQTDAAINPGNSGGALVNENGELVGINSAIATMGQQSGNIGIGFAITATQMRNIVEQLIADGEVEHSYLGVTVTDAIAEIDGVGRRGAGIATVEPGTPAAEAGLQAGDVVTEVDDEQVDSGLALTAQVRERQPGTQVILAVVRDNGASDVPVTLGTRP